MRERKSVLTQTRELLCSEPDEWRGWPNRVEFLSTKLGELRQHFESQVKPGAKASEWGWDATNLKNWEELLIDFETQIQKLRGARRAA